MNTKRSKKQKLDIDIQTPEKNDADSQHDSVLEPATSDSFNTSNEQNSFVTPPPVNNKRKKNPSETPKRVKKPRTENNENSVKRVRKRKVKQPNVNNEQQGELESIIKVEDTFINGSPGDMQNNSRLFDAEIKREEVTWPNRDIAELINRMERSLPEKDNLKYKSRIEKFNWEEIAFGRYSPEDCKRTWLAIQKQIRSYRLLSEILKDAKDWIVRPKNHSKGRPRRHPDMPKRPMTAQVLFYTKVREQLRTEHPGVERGELMKIAGQHFKNLPPERREQYEKESAALKKEYVSSLKVFFESHPEFAPSPKSSPTKTDKAKDEKLAKVEKPVKVEKDKLPKPENKPGPKPERLKAVKEKPPKLEKTPQPSKAKPGRVPKPEKDRPPKRWQSSFRLFYQAESKNMEAEADKAVFREKCKEMYKQMPDGQKVYWINLAEEDLLRYKREAKLFKQGHPDYSIMNVKSVLTKGEKSVKERASGKPVKPPNSAYALYSRVMLKSEDIKGVHPKDRMNVIASNWKNCSEEEKNDYKDRVDKLMAKYKADYDAYVATLPEDERKKLFPTRKKKKTKRRGSASRSSPKRKPAKKAAPVPKENTENKENKVKFEEPEQPPISPSKYFASIYQGEGRPLQIWKSLSIEEKKKYEAELTKKKQIYIKEFEQFLKSLTKDELEAYSKSRQQARESGDEEDEDDDDDDDEEESSDCSSGAGSDEEDEDKENGDDENERVSDSE